MKFLAVLLLSVVGVFGATVAPSTNIVRFPSIALNNQTNIVSDNGSALTFNGTPIGGSGVNYWVTNLTTLPTWGVDAPTITPVDTNSTLVIGSAFQMFGDVGDPNVTALMYNNIFGIIPSISWFWSTNAYTDASGGGATIYAQSGNTNLVDNQGFALGMMNFLVYNDITNNIDPANAFFTFIATQVEGASAVSAYTNATIFEFSNDGVIPNILVGTSDGYVSGQSSGRIGINSQTPDATLDVVSRWSDKPQQLWRHFDDESILASLSYGGEMETKAGFSSLATDAAVAISATGWTNTFGKTAEVWFRGTNTTYTIANNAGTLIRTNLTTTGVDTLQFILQTGGKMVVTSGTVVGSATPF